MRSRIRRTPRCRELELGPGRNVLIAHGGIDAARATYSEPGAVELDRAVLASAGVDYAALGHLHAFARVGSNAVYAGSLERLDFADESDKVLVVVDLEGSVSVEPAPFRPVFTLAVACAGLGPAEVLDAIAAAVAARDCSRGGRAAAAGRARARRLPGARHAARVARCWRTRCTSCSRWAAPGCRRGRRASRTRAWTSRPSRVRACPRAWTRRAS